MQEGPPDPKENIREFYRLRGIDLESANWFLKWLTPEYNEPLVDIFGFHKFKAKCIACYGTGVMQNGAVGKMGSLRSVFKCYICDGGGEVICPQYCVECEMPQFYGLDDDCNYCKVKKILMNGLNIIEPPDNLLEKIMKKLEEE